VRARGGATTLVMKYQQNFIQKPKINQIKKHKSMSNTTLLALAKLLEQTPVFLW